MDLSSLAYLPRGSWLPRAKTMGLTPPPILPAGKITLSIKAREIAEEKEALSEFGSTDSGASLGDILGAAIAKKEAEKK